jgi:hypothetical protein
MIARITAAVALLGTLVTGAPAHADMLRASCGFDANSQQTVTGGDFVGAAYGYATFDDEATHTLRCVLFVNGVERDATPLATGTRLLTSSGPLHYTSEDGDRVDVYTEVDGVLQCNGCYNPQFPPQWVFDTIDTVNAVYRAVYQPVDDAEVAYVDPVVCPALAALAPGVPGVLDITPAGDTTLVGISPLWDCPPYGDLF